jgi:hypothetical protein
MPKTIPVASRDQFYISVATLVKANGGSVNLTQVGLLARPRNDVSGGPSKVLPLLKACPDVFVIRENFPNNYQISLRVPTNASAGRPGLEQQQPRTAPPHPPMRREPSARRSAL